MKFAEKIENATHLYTKEIQINGRIVMQGHQKILTKEKSGIFLALNLRDSDEMPYVTIPYKEVREMLKKREARLVVKTSKPIFKTLV